MSRRLPALSFREVVRALERLGFQIDHVTGSHYRLKHTQDSRRTTVVPRHSRDVKRGVLRSIIRQAGLTVEEFLDALQVSASSRLEMRSTTVPHQLLIYRGVDADTPGTEGVVDAGLAQTQTFARRKHQGEAATVVSVFEVGDAMEAETYREYIAVRY